jgi:hypothetical protein
VGTSTTIRNIGASGETRGSHFGKEENKKKVQEGAYRRVDKLFKKGEFHKVAIITGLLLGGRGGLGRRSWKKEGTRLVRWLSRWSFVLPTFEA